MTFDTNDVRILGEICVEGQNVDVMTRGELNIIKNVIHRERGVPRTYKIHKLKMLFVFGNTNRKMQS